MRGDGPEGRQTLSRIPGPGMSRWNHKLQPHRRRNLFSKKNLLPVGSLTVKELTSGGGGRGFTLTGEPHCQQCEEFTRLKTASCEAGPETTHMCILEICIWSLHILENANRCVYNNFICDFSKCYLLNLPISRKESKLLPLKM